MGSKSEVKVEPADAEALLKQGKDLVRSLNIEKATEILGQALQLRVEKYGELAIETAQYYFEYGKALLEVCKASSSLLGNKGAQPQQPETEDADDWQISWELLEAARLSYEKELKVKPSKELKLALAEVYICLAEINREQERFKESYQDFEKTLRIFESVLGKYDRQVAFAHQEMATNCVYSNDSGKALHHYKCVREVLDVRIVSQYEQLRNVAKDSKVPEKASGKMMKVEANDNARIKAVEKATRGIEKFVKEILELTDCRDEVVEKINALVEVSSTSNKENEDILTKLASRAQEKAAGTSASSGSGSNGHVTIGFGGSSATKEVGAVTKLGTFGSAKTEKTATLIQTRKRTCDSSTDSGKKKTKN